MEILKKIEELELLFEPKSDYRNLLKQVSKEIDRLTKDNKSLRNTLSKYKQQVNRQARWDADYLSYEDRDY